MNNREERIKEIAYRLWEQEGRPDGHSDRLCRAAEAQYEADIAKERYEEEIAKDEPAGEPARSAEPKSHEPLAEPPPAPSAKKAAEPVPDTKSRASQGERG